MYIAKRRGIPFRFISLYFFLFLYGSSGEGCFVLPHDGSTYTLQYSPPCYLPAVSLIGTNHHPLRVNNICFFFILSYLQVSCLDFIRSSSFFLFFFFASTKIQEDRFSRMPSDDQTAPPVIAKTRTLQRVRARGVFYFSFFPNAPSSKWSFFHLNVVFFFIFEKVMWVEQTFFFFFLIGVGRLFLLPPPYGPLCSHEIITSENSSGLRLECVTV